MKTKFLFVITLLICLYGFIQLRDCSKNKLNFRRIVSDSVTSINIKRYEDEKQILLTDSLKAKFVMLLNQSEYNSEINPRHSKPLFRVRLKLNDNTEYTIDIISMFESENIAIIPYESKGYYYNSELGIFVQEVFRRVKPIER